MRILHNLLTMSLLLCIAALGVACGGEQSGPGADSTTGWEKGSEFDRMYKIAEYEKIKGDLVEFIEITPMEGMAPGVGVIVKDRADGEDVVGILGPKAFVKDQHTDMNVREGQKLKLYGSWARIDGKDYIIATKIKRTDKNQLKVRRTQDGMAYWSMSAEELQAEIDAYEEDLERIAEAMEEQAEQVKQN